MKFTLLLLLSLCFGVSVSVANSEPLVTGQSIPDPALRTEEGAAVKLSEALDGRPSVLIFYRGGWCPYCTKHLSALASIEAELLEAGYRIFAISPDQPSVIRETPDRENLKYTLLSDSSAAAAKAFGLVFQVPGELVSKYKNEYQIDLEAASGMDHHQLPHPAVFIVDAAGVIQFVHVDENYRERLEPEKILEAVRASE